MAVVLGKETLDLAEQIAKRIYEGEDLIADRKLLQSSAQDLMSGVHKGLGKREVDWDNPDADMIQHLTENVYQFAAAKNYHELRDLTDAVHDDDKVRTFEEYEKEVGGIVGKYNRDWLRTEYNQAIAASQSAARWYDFKRHENDMPYLQYQCVMDGNTRPEHAALDGIIKRIDDPFWDKYMPPNGWGCRCEAIQLPGSHYQETPNDQIHPSGVPDMFQTNFGKKGLIFPPAHAYYRGIPKDVWDGLKRDVKASVLKYYSDAAEAVMPISEKLANHGNLQSGKLLQKKKSLHRLLNHSRSIEEIKAARYIWEHPEELHFERVSPLGEGKDLTNPVELANIEKKRNRGVTEYLQYSFSYGKHSYQIKLERHKKGFEQFYSYTE